LFGQIAIKDLQAVGAAAAQIWHISELKRGLASESRKMKWLRERKSIYTFFFRKEEEVKVSARSGRKKKRPVIIIVSTVSQSSL
jgi:hypothetical protein